jgi:hypothetical protein
MYFFKNFLLFQIYIFLFFFYRPVCAVQIIVCRYHFYRVVDFFVIVSKKPPLTGSLIRLKVVLPLFEGFQDFSNV